jgi:pyridoxamine 5'-phosphate oxidase
MTLATANASGRPSARVVLLRDFSEKGFVFYTNLESRKAREIRANPRAALNFSWQALESQVQIEGSVGSVDPADADLYWASRPRESQLGAWASQQSRELVSREVLEARFAQLERDYAGREVPRPPHWSGFRLVPERIEFWKSMPHRLHDRTLYELVDGRWRRGLLYP